MCSAVACFNLLSPASPFGSCDTCHTPDSGVCQAGSSYELYELPLVSPGEGSIAHQGSLTHGAERATGIRPSLIVSIDRHVNAIEGDATPTSLMALSDDTLEFPRPNDSMPGSTVTFVEHTMPLAMERAPMLLPWGLSLSHAQLTGPISILPGALASSESASFHACDINQTSVPEGTSASPLVLPLNTAPGDCYLGVTANMPQYIPYHPMLAPHHTIPNSTLAWNPNAYLPRISTAHFHVRFSPHVAPVSHPQLYFCSDLCSPYVPYTSPSLTVTNPPISLSHT